MELLVHKLNFVKGRLKLIKAPTKVEVHFQTLGDAFCFPFLCLGETERGVFVLASAFLDALNP